MNIISNFPEENKEEIGIKKYVPIIAFMTACFIAMVVLAWKICQIPEEIEELGEPIVYQPIEIEEEITQDVIEEPVEEIVEEVEEEEPEVYVRMTDDDILAAIAMSEAGNQEMIGKVAVVMTVLNRCDYWNASVESIVSAPNQYAYPYTGVITEDAYEAVRIARQNRNLFPKGMMWFLPSGYPSYGHPYLQIQGHYFSYLTNEEIEEQEQG